jgi:hypothetical protein
MRRFLPRVGMMEMTTDDHLKNASCHILITLLLAFPVTLHAQKVKTRFENQFSGWTTVNFNDHTGFQLGGRYIPTLSVSDSLRNSKRFLRRFRSMRMVIITLQGITFQTLAET